MAPHATRDVRYYRDVVGLPANGIDPDDLQDEHVTESECIEVWGPRRRKGGFQLKMTDPDTKLNRRVKELWSTIYQLKVHEFGFIFAKGVLAEGKGFPINWATFAMKTDRRRKNGRLRKRMERTLSSVYDDLENEVHKEKNKVSMRMGDEEVGNDNRQGVDGNQTNNNKEDEGEDPTLTPGAARVQVEDGNKEQIDVGESSQRLDEELHGPTTSKSAQHKININKEDKGKEPMTQSMVERAEAQRTTSHEANEDQLDDVISNHPRLSEKLEGLTTSMSAYESLLHCTIGSKANLEKNIEDALSTCMACKVAIGACDSLRSQQDTIDAAIKDSTHRLRDIISNVKTRKAVGGAKGNKDAMYFSTELEDATLWHDDLLEEKKAVASKIEAESKDVEEKRSQLEVANQELLGLLLEYYKVFGKECNVLDNMQKQLELLQDGFYELKTLCDSGGVGRDTKEIVKDK